jgi:mannose/fructose/N-acetylgalactosamine-specific phosphotransferase system component IID
VDLVDGFCKDFLDLDPPNLIPLLIFFTLFCLFKFQFSPTNQFTFIFLISFYYLLLLLLLARALSFSLS